MRTILLVLLGCAGCAPTLHQLPAHALAYGEAQLAEDGVRVHVRPLTVAMAFPEGPLVPLPSLAIDIDNDGDQPLRFDRAEIRISDDSGAPYRLTRVQTALSTFGPDVVVGPRSRWSGVITFETDAGTDGALADRLHGNLYVAWRGARRGDELTAPVLVTLPLAAAPSAQDCLRGPLWTESGGRHFARPRSILDATPVTATEADEEMLKVKASRTDAANARKLRIAGGALIAAGVLGAVTVPAAVATTGHSREAPAGVASLALAGAGAAILYVAQHREQAAMNRYNRYMDETGACAAPR
jgi:hypothetical protein